MGHNTTFKSTSAAISLVMQVYSLGSFWTGCLQLVFFLDWLELFEVMVFIRGAFINITQWSNEHEQTISLAFNQPLVSINTGVWGLFTFTNEL